MSKYYINYWYRFYSDKTTINHKGAVIEFNSKKINHSSDITQLAVPDIESVIGRKLVNNELEIGLTSIFKL